MELNVSIYSVFSLLAASVDLAIGFFVLSKNYASKVNRLFFISSVALFVWGLGEFLQRSTTSYNLSYLFFIYLVPAGSVVYPPTLLYFLNNLIDNKKINTRIINFSLYIPALFFLILRYINPKLFVSNMTLKYWGYVPVFSDFYFLFLLYVAFFVALATIISIVYSLQSKGRIRKQAIFMAIGCFVATVSGLLTQVFAPIFKIEIPEMSLTFSAVYSAFIAMAVTKYGLMTLTPEKVAKDILKTINDFIIVVNNEYEIDLINDAAIKKLNYKQEDLIGRSVSKLLGTDFIKIKDSLTDKKNFQLNILTKIGENIPVSFEISEIKDSKDKIFGYVILLRDMQEMNNYINELQKKTNALLGKGKILEEQQRAVLNILEDVEAEKEKTKKFADRLDLATKSAKIGIFEFNVAKNLLTWNRQTENIFGKTRKRLLGDLNVWLKESVHPEDQARVKMEFDQAFTEKNDYESVYRIVWPDKSIHYVKHSATIKTDDSGKPVRAVGVIWDVTSEMEVDRAKTEFVSLASHQLRTPLSAINWYTEMLLAGDAGKLNKEQKQYLEEIYHGNQRMVELVNSLLNVSRLELGTFAIEPEMCNITDLAEIIVKEISPEIAKKKQKFTKKYSKNIPQTMLDKKLTIMILQNLLSNAIKYTPEKGKVNLEIGLEKGCLQIKISDSGLGIPASQQNKIFSKLFRADNVRATDTEGTGLGLYIIKSILDNVNGKIWFESIENKGTTFFVCLPPTGMIKKEGTKGLA